MNDTFNVIKIIENPERWYGDCTDALARAASSLSTYGVDATGRLDDFDYLFKQHQNANDPTVRTMRSHSDTYRTWLEQQKKPAEAVSLAVKRLEIAQQMMAGLVQYTPGNLPLDGVLTTLATLLDVHIKNFELLSKVPEATRDVLRLKTTAESMIRTASELSLHTAGNELKKVINSFGLKPKDKNMLSMLAVEYGAYSEITTTDVPAQAIALGRITSFDEYMTSIGLTPAQQTELKTAASLVHRSFDDMRLWANAFGSYVPRLDNIPYSPRVFTNKAALEDAMGFTLGDMQKVQMFDVTAGVAERKLYWYSPLDQVSLTAALGLVPPGGRPTPSPHLIAPLATINMDIPLNSLKIVTKKGTVTVADTYYIPREARDTFLSKNTDVVLLPDKSKADVNVRLMKEGVELTKKEVDKISNSYLPSEVDPVMRAINKDYIVIDDTNVYVFNTASPTFNTAGMSSFNPQAPGLHQTTNLVTHGLATRGTRGVDGRKPLRSGGYATGNDALISVKKALNAEVTGLTDARKKQLYFDKTGKNAVVYDVGKRTVVITSSGYVPGNFTTSAQYKWFTGRATELKDSTGFKSKFISDYDEVEIVKAKTKQSSRDALITRLRSEVKKSNNFTPEQKTKYRQELDGANLSNERLSAIAEEIATNSMNKKAFLVEHSDTGKYEILAFTDDVVEDFNADLVTELMENPVALLEYIKGGVDDAGNRTAGRISDKQLERLVDAGILTKIPMTNPEVWGYIRSKFNLPWMSPNDMISGDLQHVMQMYTKNLYDASAVSFIYTTIAEQGEAAGWVRHISQNPPKGWVQFSGLPNFSQSLIAQGKGELAGRLKDLYIDPNIATYLTTVTKVITDPIYTGYLAKFWHDVSSVTVSAMLAFGSPLIGASYVAMNTITDWFTSVGAGSNIYTMPASIKDILETLVKKPEQIFDDTVPFLLDADTAQEMTQLQAYYKFMNNYNRGTAAGTSNVGVSPSTGGAGGTIGEVISSIAGSSKDAVGYGARDAYSVLRYAFTSSQAYTGARWVTAITGTLNKLARGTLTPAINLTSIIQRALMWNLWQSLHVPARRGVLNSHATKRATSFGFFNGYPTTSAGVYDVMSTAFIFGENAGTLPRSLGNNGVMNFAPYIIKTPFNVLNQIMANPIPFYNYIRLLQFTEEFKQDQDEVTQAQMYYQSGTYIGSVPDPTDPTNEDKRAGIMLYNNYNPYAAFLEMGRQGLRFMTGEPEDMNDFVDQQMKSETEKFWTDIRATLYQPLGFLPKLVGAVAFGLDYEGSPLRNRDAGAVDSFYGKAMPPRVATVLRMLPLFGAIDKYNSFGWYGQAEIIDPWTGEVEQEMQGGRARESRQEKVDRYGNMSMRLLQWIGFDYSVQPFDESEVRSIQALDRAVDAQTTEFNNVKKKLDRAANVEGSLTDADIRNTREQLTEIVDTYLVLSAMKAQYDAYAYQQGRTPPSVTAKIQSAADARRYAENGDEYVRQELERVVKETQAVYDKLSNYEP